jgi:hypothetical protein
VLLAVILIIVGPKNLPSAARKVGEIMSNHFADMGIGSDLYVGTVSNEGARVLNSSLSSR